MFVNMTDLDKISQKLGELGEKLEGDPKQLSQTLREYQAYFEGVSDNEDDENMKKDLDNLILFFKMCSDLMESARELGDLDKNSDLLSEMLTQLKTLEKQIDTQKLD